MQCASVEIADLSVFTANPSGIGTPLALPLLVQTLRMSDMLLVGHIIVKLQVFYPSWLSHIIMHIARRCKVPETVK